MNGAMNDRNMNNKKLIGNLVKVLIFKPLFCSGFFQKYITTSLPKVVELSIGLNFGLGNDVLRCKSPMDDSIYYD